MWDCLDYSYVTERLRQSPLRVLDNRPQVFPPGSDLSTFLKLSFDSFTNNGITGADITFIRDSLCLICTEIADSRLDYSYLLRILSVIRSIADTLEIGGPDLVYRTLEMRHSLLEEEERVATEELLENAADRFNDSGEFKCQ